MVWHGMAWYGMVWHGMACYVCMYVCMYVCTYVYMSLLDATSRAAIYESCFVAPEVHATASSAQLREMRAELEEVRQELQAVKQVQIAQWRSEEGPRGFQAGKQGIIAWDFVFWNILCNRVE